jgi:hypothetical protein
VAAFLRGLLMWMLGLCVLVGVFALLVFGWLGLSLRRLLRWMRGQPQPVSEWQALRNAAATAVWQRYKSRREQGRAPARASGADVVDVDFREAPRSAQTPEVGRLPS